MRNRADAPIGVFDSGVGGLTVARQIVAAMPHEEIVYFGDCLRAPYGDRGPEQLADFSRQIVDFLTAKGVKALVVACGTISARIFETVAQMTDVPIIGMVKPGVDAALTATKTGRIGVLATAGTVASGAHKAAISAKRPDANVFAVACPLFVPLVEEGWFDGDVADLVAKKYVSALENSGADAVLLGCTHYPLLACAIEKALPPGVAVIDPAIALADSLKGILAEQNLLREDGEKPTHQFYISGGKEKFDGILKMIFGQKYEAKIVKI